MSRTEGRISPTGAGAIDRRLLGGIRHLHEGPNASGPRVVADASDYAGAAVRGAHPEPIAALAALRRNAERPPSFDRPTPLHDTSPETSSPPCPLRTVVSPLWKFSGDEFSFPQVRGEREARNTRMSEGTPVGKNRRSEAWSCVDCGSTFPQVRGFMIMPPPPPRPGSWSWCQVPAPQAWTAHR